MYPNNSHNEETVTIPILFKHEIVAQGQREAWVKPGFEPRQLSPESELLTKASPASLVEHSAFGWVSFSNGCYHCKLAQG